LAAKKASGHALGKLKSTLQKSKFDSSVEQIKELLGYGLSIRKIAKVLGCSSHIALNTSIKNGTHVRRSKANIVPDGNSGGLGLQPSTGDNGSFCRLDQGRSGTRQVFSK